MNIHKALLDKRHRKRAHKKQVCMNCGEVVHDANYCSNCGQLNSDRRIPIQEFLHTFLQDYLTFDNKFFKSLYLLLFKPGHLTREYISGRRQRYIFPFRLYLFTTFVFFLTVTMNAKLDRNIEDSDSDNNIESAKLLEVLNPHLDPVSGIDQDSIVSDLKQNFLIQERTKNSEGSFVINNQDSSESKFVAYLHRKAERMNSLGKRGKQMFVKEMIDQIPKILFIMMPAFALIMKFLYIRRKKYYIEHLIFALHFHTLVFFYLLFAILFSKWYIITGAILIILIHLFMSLKAVYEQHWLKTLVKMHFLLSLYIPLTVPAFVALALLALVNI